MPILERAAPAAAPDTTQAAIAAIRAAVTAVVASDIEAAESPSPAAEVPDDAPVESAASRSMIGHGAIRLRGRPVGPARE